MLKFSEIFLWILWSIFAFVRIRDRLNALWIFTTHWMMVKFVSSFFYFQRRACYLAARALRSSAESVRNLEDLRLLTTELTTFLNLRLRIQACIKLIALTYLGSYARFYIKAFMIVRLNFHLRTILRISLTALACLGSYSDFSMFFMEASLRAFHLLYTD